MGVKDYTESLEKYWKSLLFDPSTTESQKQDNEEKGEQNVEVNQSNSDCEV